ncbi:Glycosyltransferase subfamily 4-like N-terminal domain-containing protein [Flavobacterium longum]|uniref:glycosyltransferase family 4 protein n=1 Tax=Flavobacterium longum TaxID=1299340 RepID=UPI0039ECF1F9
MKKVIRTSTVPISLDSLLRGQLKFLNQYYDVVAVSGEGERLRSVESREGVRVHPIEMQRQIAPLKDLASLWKLYRFFKKEKPDIVHSITPKAGLLSMMAAKFAGVPVRIHMFTGLIFPTQTGIKQKILIAMDRLLCRFATHIFPEGQGVRNDLIKFNITKKPLKIIANGNVNGIDTAHYDSELFSSQQRDLRQEWKIDPDDFVFIFVGRLVKDKGIRELVDAFSSLLQSHPNAKLLLLGRFESHLDPIDPLTLKTIETTPQIITAGYQIDVRPFLALADVFVLPSYREGFPNVVMQAGAMDLPSIVTDINGANEIIIDGENGLIVPPKDEAKLVAAMQRLLEDDGLREQMAASARGLIASRYEQQTVWNAILEEYRIVAGA